LAPLQHKRLGAVATVLQDGRVLVQGGEYTDYARQNRKVVPPDELWDPRTNRWSLAPRTNPVTRKGIQWSHAPTRTPLGDGRTLVTGGKEPGYNAGPFEIDPQPEAEAYIIEMGSRKKRPAGTVCVARWMHATAVLPDGSVLLIGGANNQGAAIADVEIGLPPTFAASRILGRQVAGFQDQLNVHQCRGLIRESERARSQKRYDEALALAREALALTPRDPDARQELAYVYSAMGRHEEALVEYRRLVTKDRKSPFLWHFLACTLLHLQRRPEALDACRRVVELVQEEGEDFTTQSIYADALEQSQFLALELDGPEAALEATRPADQLATEEWNNKGVALHRQGKNTEALPCFDRALELDPRNDYALHNKAAALLKLQRPREALAALERCIALRGDRAAGSLVNQGVAHYELGDFEASVKSYERAIKLKAERPILVNAWTNRGNSLLKLKEYEQAGASYAGAIKVDPTFSTAWHGKVCVATAQGRFGDARAALEKLLTLAPDMKAELRRDPDLAPYWAWERRQ
jgi:tetratricopeptide (TPR) repeat protein